MNVRKGAAAVGLAASILGFGLGPASAGQPACLAGDGAAADRAAIAIVESAVAGACDCEAFDGSAGKTASDYKRCASAVVKAAVKGESLRSKCKGRLLKAYKASTCGLPDGSSPCLELGSDGELRCKVRKETECVSVPGRFDRLSCPEAFRCVDAADDSGDWLVSSLDSGSCRPPATTTTTLVPESTTTTLSPTTTTLPQETTTTLAPTTTTLPEATTTTTLPEEPTTTTTVPQETTTTTLEEQTTTTSTTSTTTTLECGLEQPVPVLRMFEAGEERSAPPLPPDPLALGCYPQNLSGGGCGGDPDRPVGNLYPIILEGSITNVFDASGSYVPNACPGTTLSYQWETWYPPIAGVRLFTAAGLTGASTSTLTIAPDTMPSLSTLSDHDWRVKLVITANQGANPVREVWFRHLTDSAVPYY